MLWDVLRRYTEHPLRNFRRQRARAINNGIRLTSVRAGWARHILALLIGMTVLWSIPLMVLQPWKAHVNGLCVVAAIAALICTLALSGWMHAHGTTLVSTAAGFSFLTWKRNHPDCSRPPSINSTGASADPGYARSVRSWEERRVNSRTASKGSHPRLAIPRGRSCP